MENSIGDLQKESDEHHKALFGVWDGDEQKMIPGLIGRMDRLNVYLKVLGALSLVNALSSLGVPTKDVYPLISKLIAIIH